MSREKNNFSGHTVVTRHWLLVSTIGVNQMADNLTSMCKVSGFNMGNINNIIIIIIIRDLSVNMN